MNNFEIIYTQLNMLRHSCLVLYERFNNANITINKEDIDELLTNQTQLISELMEIENKLKLIEFKYDCAEKYVENKYK